MDQVALGLDIPADKVSMAPDVRKGIKVGISVLFVSSFPPERHRHARERFRDDQLPFLPGAIDIVAVLVPDLYLHAQSGSRKFVSMYLY